jgi:hypothetical protein
VAFGDLLILFALIWSQKRNKRVFIQHDSRLSLRSM